ncbi:MAG: hypothetical protein ONB48_05170 [candidate division KSB1 bacterium]|nr:hypothetical protein [candidate division KSB1 bacterium]MDZ7276540.1 hypothetical protein [candidate division KSB1 bacterium]MDZ7285042.1 hypothetical protein [candidate division KSB1 bacterium]MDZ7298074.1 hypothetical protein [candidate division KSB1 bacterium]MDZ7307698.1 hypothetical protein [candidate division KSB1 bacterium]
MAKWQGRIGFIPRESAKSTTKGGFSPTFEKTAGQSLGECLFSAASFKRDHRQAGGAKRAIA